MRITKEIKKSNKTEVQTYDSISDYVLNEDPDISMKEKVKRLVECVEAMERDVKAKITKLEQDIDCKLNEKLSIKTYNYHIESLNRMLLRVLNTITKYSFKGSVVHLYTYIPSLPSSKNKVEDPIALKVLDKKGNRIDD